MDYVKIISQELNISQKHTANVIKLLDEGATVPFIARYRKEMTGTMNEEHVSAIQLRLKQLEELDKRKESILNAIREQGKMTEQLETLIANAMTMQEVEDLYLPYKVKRNTRAETARQKGLEPLAKQIIKQFSNNVIKLAYPFINKEKGVESPEDAIDGATDIIAEWISENIKSRNAIRRIYHRQGRITSSVAKGKDDEAENYRQYFNYDESIAKTPSHRILAILRGENEGLLKVKVKIDKEDALRTLENIFVKTNNEAGDVVRKAVETAWKNLLEPSLENEIRKTYKEKADEVAIEVFAANLKQLLLAPPLGSKRILAIDPGFRTGCKVVVLNENGNLLHNETIFPHPPQSDTKGAAERIKSLVEKHKVEFIAIGNGTAGRETEDFVKSIDLDRNVKAIMVNESGASIYSASKIARDEFPDYDITVRGAVSIGRRLMDPLAELVKIDPKSIGVGQYQHDVNQKLLGESLGRTVENCVNAVGVELNTASKELLSYVSGISENLAENIVNYRKENGAFANRTELTNVPRLGSKTFEQCAGFIRVSGSDNPLDASAVHPESYHIVRQMSKDLGISIGQLIRNKEQIMKIHPEKYVGNDVGMETIGDILAELEKPGRDPRESLEVFEFDKNIRTIDDLRAGMQLNGIVTNITAFGAFVDIGVHQDGLVHISQIADRYIKDPNEVLKINQKVKVTVIEVDIQRKRISLSMKNTHQQNK